MVSAKASLKLSETEYISHLVSFPEYVITGLTDGSILSVPVTLESKLTTISKPITGQQAPLANLLALPTIPHSFISCDTKGKLKIHDVRQKSSQVSAVETGLAVTACGVSNFGHVAVGTEASPDAQIHVFDVRKLQTGTKDSSDTIVKYVDSHNDDVTDLQFHPTQKNLLASGSTDGVVNLFDLKISNEDDAVVEAFNHQASIHRTGFFINESITSLQISEKTPNLGKLFALSHMETLTVYPLFDEDNKEKLEEFGDLRETWKCQYVCDFQKQHFLIGSNDENWAKLVPIIDNSPGDGIILEGGHGSDVIRCFDIWNLSKSCFTGGEDGCVKLWDLTGDFDQVSKFAKSVSKEKKHKGGKAVKKSKRAPY